MQTMILETRAAQRPAWLWWASVVGVLWNMYGVYQFFGSFTQAGQAAMTAGMTPSQAALYLALPGWIGLGFAIGVFGGLAGSILLVLRRRLAWPVLAASWVGYCLLFAGDAYYGVFAAIPSQLGLLAVVVLIAAALLGTSWLAGARGLLR
ncbi:hypothetical protein [Paucibacter sp. XJ19-41]|uniref:hypothetical protein n=1 Tax=Paucibacter sp. XJ19-41 TaxID=2927824 RepID=UPI002349C915|nr:hypothetical protein [Paucibacter sp. XJ19-41]MDC6169771.1 hypothetical protein [Paucibacter sp. XJ19-41]